MDDVDVFAGKVFGSIQGTMELVGICLGDKLGLYQAVQSGAATSAELAARAGIHERYAREWLEHQAVNGYLLVDHPEADAAGRRYTLASACSCACPTG